MRFPRSIAVLVTVALAAVGALVTESPASAGPYDIYGTITQGGNPLAGVTVDLGGPQTDTTITAADGTYAFVAGPAGNYTVTPHLSNRSFTPSSGSVSVNTVVPPPAVDFSAAYSPASISGTITDGVNPVGNVSIAISGGGASTTTATDGTYTFSNRAAGTYTITPSAVGRSFTPSSSTVTLAGVNSTGNNFTSTINNAVISGTVTGTGGTGITGVNVALTGGATTAFVTGSNGAYSFPSQPAGSYTVTPTLADYAFSPATSSVTLSGVAQTKNFVGTRLGSITGTVYNDVNGNGSYSTSGASREAAAVGLTAFIDLTGNGLSNDDPTALTNGAGVYTFPNLLPATYNVKVSAPAGSTIAPTVGHSVVVAENDDKTAPLTSVRYASSVAGTVFLSGLPVENAHLNIDRDGDGQLEEAVSDANGNYVFPSVPPGPAIRITPVEPTAQYSVLPLHRDVALAASQTLTGVTFVYTKAVSAHGYILAASDGGIFTHGDAKFVGSAGGTKLNAPIVGQALTSDGSGYYFVASDGGVFNYGHSVFHGSTGGQRLNSPIVGMALTPDENGYYLVAADGGVFAFGSAVFRGSMGGQRLNKPIVGITADHDGDGYTLVASDGGIFNFNSDFYGSAGSLKLNSPIVGIASDPDGAGYTLAASDGGVFNYGSDFFGSTGSIKLNKPIVGLSVAPDGEGYYMVASDGGVFSFPNAGTFDPLEFYGSEGGKALNQPIVGMAAF